MKFASWNVRGLNKGPRQKELQNFVSMYNISLMGILETKVKAHNSVGISKKFNRKWKWLFNYESHHNGRVWVGWDPSIWTVTLHSSNDQYEISGGREHWTPAMQVFKDHLSNYGLGPIRTVGDVFTWTNKREQTPVLKRLDRMVGNAAWSQDCLGNPMQQFNFKLKNVKNALRDFNKKHVNLHTLGRTFLVTKIPVKWMHKGDGNNSFFHQQCKVNWNTNKVFSLHDEEGNLVNGQTDCAKVAVSYFQSLMSNVSVSNNVDLSSVDCKSISEDQARDLVAHITNSIIYLTLKSMKRNKAPGPDGVNVEFFLATWDITGTVFCEAVKYFFATSTMPLGTNATFISLIPKVRTPSRMQELLGIYVH
ncbi:uncharacterized protein LOC141686147 [Apium graveolens]|uniref:uncharacterized protein LOC141686147 n=1 Tax=Apium graveolens TaxID=4045 RepID=UPI003D7B505D